MVALSTTKLSSKGQVVIPEEIRVRLGLKAGSRFTVMGDRGVVVLRAIEAPSVQELGKMLKKTRAAARKGGMKKSDIARAIRKVRGAR